MRGSDGADIKVEFTVVRRDRDGHALIFRDTIPDAVAADDPARAELIAAECAAAVTFGVQIGQCAAIPAQGDG